MCEYIDAQGISREDFARLCGRSVSWVHKLCTGELGFTPKSCHALETGSNGVLTVEELLRLSEKPPTEKLVIKSGIKTSKFSPQ